MNKYITLPHDFYERLQNKSSDIKSKLDKNELDLYDIMNKNISSDEKRVLYQQALQSLLHKNEILNRPSKIEIHEDQEPLQKESNYEKFEEAIAGSLPKTYISKGLALFKYLQGEPSITWSDNGQISIDNKPVANSNIVDLVSALTRNIKNAPKTRGWYLIKNHFRKINFPTALIGNENTAKDLLNTSNYQTPQADISPIRRKLKAKRRLDYPNNDYAPDRKIIKWFSI